MLQEKLQVSFIYSRKPAPAIMPGQNRKSRAFSLIELLVVIAVIALLLSITLPSLLTAKKQARTVICRSNLHQMVLANIGYALANDGFYVPAAPDILLNNGGYRRWHGTRDSPDKPFDPDRSPLASYLSDSRSRNCPESVQFLRRNDWNTNFENGCGGYGYNMTYIGSSLWQHNIDFDSIYTRTARTTDLQQPAHTLMFADCAMSMDGSTYIEYSFAEPPFAVFDGSVYTDVYMSASIHFRHTSRANIGWSDGHAGPEKIAPAPAKNIYGVDSFRMKLGWFDPIDNTPFDLE